MSSALSTKPFRIGMLGAGTVGGGVYELIMGKNPSSNTRPVTISKICVRSLEKSRDFQIHTNETIITTDISELLKDDIDCLVEVAGGCGVAKDTVLSALKSGKIVVTANKALLAEHMDEVEDAAKDTRLGYEAAVCGGIPIIDVLTTGYAGDTIQCIAGICNGTTNFMLSAMADDTSVQYADILKQAQDLGFAEADPTADVEGHDVRAKIAILAKLAYGVTVSIDQIPCTGISSITPADFTYAKENNCTIKLIGTATKGDDDNQLSVYVTPAIVPLSHQLATISGCGNCVAITSKNMGLCSYSGPGAGRFPTANSIVADIYRAASNTLPVTAFPIPKSASTSTTTNNVTTIVQDYSASFYIRIPSTKTGADLLCKIGNVAEQCNVTIASLKQKDDGDNMTQVSLTTNTTAKRSEVDNFCQTIKENLNGVSGNPLYMPVI